MKRPVLLALLLVLAALGAGAVWWLATAAPASDVAAAPGPADAPAPRGTAAPPLASGGGSSTGPSAVDRDLAAEAELPAVAPAADRRAPLGGPRVRGVVRDTRGEPVTEFQILFRDHGQGVQSSRTVVSAEGRFDVELPPDDRWDVWAQAEGYEPSAARTLDAAALDEQVELVLERIPALAGRVVDPEGAPVPNAEVEAQDTHGKLHRTDTGEKGRFALTGLAPGTVSLRAEGEGFATSETLEVLFDPEVPGEPLELRLREGATLVGWVLDTIGAPLEDADVELEMVETRRDADTESDASGWFELSGLDAGPAVVQAFVEIESEDDGRAWEAKVLLARVELVAGEMTEVVLGGSSPHGVRVHGRVLHGDEPQEEQILVAIPEGGGGGGDVPLAFTDEQGRYSMDLPEPGTWVFYLGRDGDLEGGDIFPEQVPDAREHALDFHLSRSGLVGVVRDAGGRTVEAARVTLVAQQGVSWLRRVTDPRISQVTGVDGRFRFDHLRPGLYTLRVGTSDARNRAVLPPAARLVLDGLRIEDSDRLTEVELLLERAARASGEVVDAEGQPVVGSQVFARAANGHFVSLRPLARSGEDGTFVCPTLPSGTMTFLARTDRGVSPESAPLRVAPGEAARIRLVIGSGTRLVLTMQDSAGRALGGSFHVRDGRGRDLAVLPADEDDDLQVARGLAEGAVLVGPLPPGDYRVEATSADGRIAVQSVTLRGEAERRVVLRP